LRVIALRVTLLATESVLRVLLLALVVERLVTGTATAAIRLGVLGGGGNVE
jgi:hypothetical protein